MSDQLPLVSPDVSDDSDLLAWRNTFASVFAMPAATAEGMDVARDSYREQRLTGVKEDGRWVATFRTWDGDSGVPGPSLTGAGEQFAAGDARTLSTELVSTVCVAPTHRRRGLLSRMMRDALDHAAQSGRVVASLFASEAAIYGRFGFGVATQVVDLAVDTRAAQRWHDGVPTAPGRIRLSDDDELAQVGPALFDAARRHMPGAVPRNAISWARLLERVPPVPSPDGSRLRAVHVDEAGQVDGYVRLRLSEKWVDGVPRNEVSVDDLTGATPAVVAALWQFCLGMDLVRHLTAGHRGPGELLAHLPVDARAVRETARTDGHWWRVLDTPAALTTRTWSRPGRLVLQVADPAGPAGGRWSVDVDEDGRAEVGPTDASADLTLPVQTLPAVLTGVLDLRLLALAGQLDEHTAGAVRHLEQMSRVSPVGLAPVQGF